MFSGKVAPYYSFISSRKIMNLFNT